MTTVLRVPHHAVQAQEGGEGLQGKAAHVIDVAALSPRPRVLGVNGNSHKAAGCARPPPLGWGRDEAAGALGASRRLLPRGTASSSGWGSTSRTQATFGRGMSGSAQEDTGFATGHLPPPPGESRKGPLVAVQGEEDFHTKGSFAVRVPTPQTSRWPCSGGGEVGREPSLH